MTNPNKSNPTAEDREPSVRPTAAPSQNSPDTTPKQKSDFSRIHRIKSAAEIAGWILLIGCGFLGAKTWLEGQIDKTVERKLSDPTILRKIAAESRPMLVFKGNDSIVADEGAAQFIKELKVTHTTTIMGTNMPTHIHIELTKFFPQTPILTLISPAFCVVTTERGKGYSWEFNLEFSSMAVTEDIGDQLLFRFEILP
jgi:hypothetical protein